MTYIMKKEIPLQGLFFIEGFTSPKLNFQRRRQPGHAKAKMSDPDIWFYFKLPDVENEDGR
jgi:hypothetical protein